MEQSLTGFAALDIPSLSSSSDKVKAAVSQLFPRELIETS
jgi:hypothetical protein